MRGAFIWWKAGDRSLRSLSNTKAGIARRTKTQCYIFSVIGWREVLLLCSLSEGLELGNSPADWVVLLDYVGIWGDIKHSLFDFLGKEGRVWFMFLFWIIKSFILLWCWEFSAEIISCLAGQNKNTLSQLRCQWFYRLNSTVMSNALPKDGEQVRGRGVPRALDLGFSYWPTLSIESSWL